MKQTRRPGTKTGPAWLGRQPLPQPIKQPDRRRWFKVLGGAPYMSLAFEAVAQHRAQIEFNHGQTLEELDAKGGLDWYELYCGFTGRALFPSVAVKPDVARDFVVRAVQHHSFSHDKEA